MYDMYCHDRLQWTDNSVNNVSYYNQLLIIKY